MPFAARVIVSVEWIALARHTLFIICDVMLLCVPS